MALTRKFLKAMGIEEDKIDQIIDAHLEVKNDLERQRDGYKADADKLPGVQRELDNLKTGDGEDYKSKYETEKANFERYKNDVAEKESAAVTERLYRAELTALGLTGKRADAIVRATDMATIKVKEGALEDAKAVQDGIRENWGEFIPTTTTQGAHVATPPANTGAKMTREQIVAIKDPTERRAAIASNMELFQKQ